VKESCDDYGILRLAYLILVTDVAHTHTLKKPTH